MARKGGDARRRHTRTRRDARMQEVICSSKETVCIGKIKGAGVRMKEKHTTRH